MLQLQAGAQPLVGCSTPLARPPCSPQGLPSALAAAVASFIAAIHSDSLCPIFTTSALEILTKSSTCDHL